MSEGKREVSGFFLSAEKFAQHVSGLSSPHCSTTHLRLFHNEPHHTDAILHALKSNTSVISLDIYELDPAAATSLCGILSATNRLTSLALHNLHGADTVKHLAAGLAANNSLTHLHFSQLDAAGVAAIASAIASWSTSLSSVALSTPFSPPSPSSSSSSRSRLQHLQLQRCRLNIDAATALAAALQQQAASLAHLDLSTCDIPDDTATALLAPLAASPSSPSSSPSSPPSPPRPSFSSLTHLDLSSCQLGAKAAALLGRFLAAPGCRLETCTLASNRHVGCAGATALAAGLSSNRSLTRLDLSGCGVGVAGAAALAGALTPAAAVAGAAAERAPSPGAEAAVPPLQHLALNENASGAAGLLALLRAMASQPPAELRSLSLERNHIRGADLAPALAAADGAGAGAGAGAPPSPPTSLAASPLEQLALGGNALYDTGVTALAAVLATAPCLEQLDLRENGVADAGVVALLPLIAGSGSGPGSAAGVRRPGLQGLLLDGNRLHNAGGQALLEAVTAAPGLWRISAEANKLTDPALRLSLAQLGQQRAARHSQLVALGRQYSSSSSSSSSAEGSPRRRGSDDDDEGPDGGRGGAAGGSRSHDRRGGGAGGQAGNTAMDTDGPNGGGGGAAPGGMQDGQRNHAQAGPGGEAGGNRTERGRWASAGGASDCYDVSMSGSEGSYGGFSSGESCRDEFGARPLRGSSSGDSSGSEGGGRPGSPPHGAARVGLEGRGGAAAAAGCVKRAGSVSDAPAVSNAGCRKVGAAGCAPQQVLPAWRRPRYKPLTPEQQRLFDDF